MASTPKTEVESSASTPFASSKAAKADKKGAKPIAADLPIKVEVRAVAALKASDAGTDEDVAAGATFMVDEAEAYSLVEDGKVVIAGMAPANSTAAREAAGLGPKVHDEEGLEAANEAAKTARASARAKAAESDAAVDATRYGNREGQSPPNAYGVANANAPAEAFTSTDELAEEEPAGNRGAETPAKPASAKKSGRHGKSDE